MPEEPIAIDGRTVRTLLPHGHPFLLLDAVRAYRPRGRSLEAYKLVSQNEPFLTGHFPSYPILPGVLIIETLAQASGMLMNLDQLTERGTPPERIVEAFRSLTVPESFLAESKVKHMAGVYPGDRLDVETSIALRNADLYVFKVQASVRSAPVARGQLTLAAKLTAGGAQ